MEAKDTVMSEDLISKAKKYHTAIIEAVPSVYESDVAIAQAQAEISFKAGIREVVGLLDKPCPHTGGIEEQQMRAIDCSKCWEAKLEEWGITNE